MVVPARGEKAAAFVDNRRGYESTGRSHTPASKRTRSRASRHHTLLASEQPLVLAAITTYIRLVALVWLTVWNAIKTAIRLTSGAGVP